jgi:hypothetical protein
MRPGSTCRSDIRGLLAAATLYTLVFAACASAAPPSGSSATSEARARARRTEWDELSAGQRLERLRQGKARICTPGHNIGALLHGGGPYCLPFDAICGGR